MARVVRDRVGDLVEARIAVGTSDHEARDALGTFRLDTRRDVDEHRGRGDRRLGLTDREQRGETAERGADERGWCFELRDHGAQVGRETLQTVGRFAGCPVALAVATQVERDRQAAVARERIGGAAPCVPRLAAAVQEQHRGSARIAARVGAQRHAVGAVERERARCVGVGGA